MSSGLLATAAPMTHGHHAADIKSLKRWRSKRCSCSVIITEHKTLRPFSWTLASNEFVLGVTDQSSHLVHYLPLPLRFSHQWQIILDTVLESQHKGWWIPRLRSQMIDHEETSALFHISPTEVSAWVLLSALTLLVKWKKGIQPVETCSDYFHSFLFGELAQIGVTPEEIHLNKNVRGWGGKVTPLDDIDTRMRPTWSELLCSCALIRSCTCKLCRKSYAQLFAKNITKN